MFTLADLIASSGAAPQLQLLLGTGVPKRFHAGLAAAAGAFPAFNPIAIRDGKPVAPGGELAHGDGGFTDNLGLMPLLARLVKHIIAFVNSNQPATANDQLQSYFHRLAVQNGRGDKTMNVVFPGVEYAKLLRGLEEAGRIGPAVFCQHLSVAKSELYNIAAYGGLKICWVYNFAPDAWREGLPNVIQGWLDRTTGLKDLRHFPYYETFAQNKPYVIKLNALQVNLLANLATWSITHPATRATIARWFGEDILPTQ
jgi:hypothetical protein